MTDISELTPEVMIELVRHSAGQKAPAWLLDIDRAKSNSPLSKAEQSEFAEFCVEQLRSMAAMEWLLHCKQRYGMRGNEYIFRHHNIVIGLNKNLIELVLQDRIESALLSEFPNDGVVAVMRFYMGDQLNKAKGKSKLMDVISFAFCLICESLAADDLSQPKQVH